MKLSKIAKFYLKNRKKRFHRCALCGEKIRLFKFAHNECKSKYNNEINNLISFNITDLSNIKNAVDSLKFLQEHEIKKLLATIWGKYVDSSMKKGILAKDNENILLKFADYFDLSQEELNIDNKFTRVSEGIALRYLSEGKCPENIQIDINSLPFNLKKGEKVVWLFNYVKYIETKTKVRYEGGSRGMSFRIAKGIYYRTGSYRGNAIKYDVNEEKDIGILLITNMHIYFSGSECSFRIPFEKIVSFTPYSDGLGVQRDAKTAKPQSFILLQNDDSVFLYNLVVNATKL